MHNSESHVVWISADSRLSGMVFSLHAIRQGGCCRESYVMSLNCKSSLVFSTRNCCAVIRWKNVAMTTVVNSDCLNVRHAQAQCEAAQTVIPLLLNCPFKSLASSRLIRERTSILWSAQWKECKGASVWRLGRECSALEKPVTVSGIPQNSCHFCHASHWSVWACLIRRSRQRVGLV